MKVTTEKALRALDELRNYDPNDILRRFRRDADINAKQILRGYLTAAAEEEAEHPTRKKSFVAVMNLTSIHPRGGPRMVAASVSRGATFR